MSDPLQGQKLPANVISEDVAWVMDAAPKPVHFAPLETRLDSATWAQLKLMASGIGEPSE